MFCPFDRSAWPLPPAHSPCHRSRWQQSRQRSHQIPPDHQRGWPKMDTQSLCVRNSVQISCWLTYLMLPFKNPLEEQQSRSDYAKFGETLFSEFVTPCLQSFCLPGQGYVTRSVRVLLPANTLTGLKHTLKTVLSTSQIGRVTGRYTLVQFTDGCLGMILKQRLTYVTSSQSQCSCEQGLLAKVCQQVIVILCRNCQTRMLHESEAILKKSDMVLTASVNVHSFVTYV